MLLLEVLARFFTTVALVFSVLVERLRSITTGWALVLDVLADLCTSATALLPAIFLCSLSQNMSLS